MGIVKASSSGIFRNRNFLAYFGMYLSSRSAFQVANVGLIWLVNAVTHSALDIAVVGVANTLSTVIVTLPAGVWIDRVDRRMLLLLSNAASAACLLSLTILTAVSPFDLAFVVVLVVAWAAASEFYRSTSYSTLPDFVAPGQLSNANGVTQSGYQIMSSISTVLGGGLIVVGGVILTFGYGTAAYALSALFSGFLFYRLRESRRPEVVAKRNMAREIKEGFVWLLTQRGLLGLSLYALIINFLFGIPTYFLVIYVTATLKAGPLIYAGMLAVFVAGGAVGSLIAGRTPVALAHAGKVNILTLGLGGGILIIVLGLFPETAVALGAATGIGLGSGFGNIVWLTAAQNIVPIEMRGRYFAIDGLLSFVGGPPSIAVGGILTALIGIDSVFTLCGTLLVASAVGFSFMRSLWSLDGRLKEEGELQHSQD